MIDLNVAHCDWHTWAQRCWRRLTGALTLLDLRHGNAPDRVRLKPRGHSYMGSDLPRLNGSRIVRLGVVLFARHGRARSTV
jgi:hypothetical protein